MRPSKIKPKFQIVVPINEITVNVTTFMRFTPAGMVINTRNTGMKRQINTAHTPYFLNQSFARFKSLLFNLIHLPCRSIKRYRRSSEIKRQI